jgi:hypothetical protein
MATKAGTTTVSLQNVQISAKIDSMLTMVKGHRYHKYDSSSSFRHHRTLTLLTKLTCDLLSRPSLRRIRRRPLLRDIDAMHVATELGGQVMNG